MTEYFRWWVVDTVTGERQRTNTYLNREDARRLYPGAVIDLSSRQFREEESFADTLPPE
jgi:hypothetical protein